MSDEVDTVTDWLPTVGGLVAPLMSTRKVSPGLMTTPPLKVPEMLVLELQPDPPTPWLVVTSVTVTLLTWQMSLPAGNSPSN